MATIGGANAMGLPHIGSIQTDALADIILVSTRYVGLNPIFNPLSNIVYAGSGRDVDTVIVNGRILMRKQHLLTIDEQSIIKQTNTHAIRLLHKTGIDIGPYWPVL